MLFKYINQTKTQEISKVLVNKTTQKEIKRTIVLQLLFLIIKNYNLTLTRDKSNQFLNQLLVFLEKLQHKIKQLVWISNNMKTTTNIPPIIYTNIINTKPIKPRRVKTKKTKINQAIKQHWIFLKKWLKINQYNIQTPKDMLLRTRWLSVRRRTNLRRKTNSYKLNRRKDLLAFYKVHLKHHNTKNLPTAQHNPSRYEQTIRKKTKIYANLVSFYITNPRKRPKGLKNRNKPNLSLFFLSHNYIASKSKITRTQHLSTTQPNTWIFLTDMKNLKRLPTLLCIQTPINWTFRINITKPINPHHYILRLRNDFSKDAVACNLNDKTRMFKHNYFTRIFDNVNHELTMYNYLTNNYLNLPAWVVTPTINKIKNTTHKNANAIAVLYMHASNLWERVLILTHTQTSSNHVTQWTNYTPLLYFVAHKSFTNYKNILARTFYNTIDTVQTSKYKTFFIFFLIQFLENFLKKKIWIRVDTRDETPTAWDPYIHQFCYSTLAIYKKFNRLLPIRETLEILLLTAKTHDLQIFLYFLKYRLETAHFKKHKKMLSILFDILRKNRPVFSQFGLKGFFFDIRGKVGVSGNAKKRHLNFSFGKITTTSQNVRSYWQQIHVWTPTGQMGITCYLLY